MKYHDIIIPLATLIVNSWYPMNTTKCATNEDKVDQTLKTWYKLSSTKDKQNLLVHLPFIRGPIVAAFTAPMLKF